MELIQTFIDLFVHLDRHLSLVIQHYGLWTYLLLFLIVFCETGLVVTPFLPGDSLLFGLGALAASSPLQVDLLFGLLTVAAIAGDMVNYWIGFFTGPKIFHKENVRFLNKAHLMRAHQFYEKHGGKTIIIARFAPIIRTFAPFVAGIGRMNYHYFTIYNVVGGAAWVAIFLFGGYFFGNIPFIKNNFTPVIMAIIILSLLPVVVEFLRARYKAS